jgi:EAL domain-containing protein (putative c-di-GMP-specific phosphodiesterase class I)/HAMP domain-containing protein
MRFGLQARFIAIVLLAGAIALIAALAVHHQMLARDQVVSQAMQELLDRSNAPQASDEQQQGAITARIEAADHRYAVEMALTLVVLGVMFMGFAMLVSQLLLQPILRLADVARKIEAGDEISPLPDSQRDDEIGDLACAFGTLGDALAAMRRRMDHDAAPPSQQPLVLQPRPALAGGTMVLPAAVPAKPVKATEGINRPPPAPAVTAPAKLSLREAERLVRLEDDLREAWQRDEMKVVYQPIHALADGSMRGAEALLRWQHRIEGTVLPDEFIPLAERSDLIIALGRHVLLQACSDASLWPSGGTPETTPFLSVNVAERQLRDPQLFEAVVDALRRSGMAASRLHLELPVATLRDDDHAIEAMIEQLRGLGVQIWLDATGADAVDQSHWLKSPVDGVKVGRSRIADKTGAAEAGQASIVATARALRIVAVVVGVEELAELNVLREQGCDLAQGYVLCKPVSTAEIGRRLLA